MQHNLTKVSLSKDEWDLVNNAQILLTKNEIIRKVYAMFGELAAEYASCCKGVLPDEVLVKQPKIARGENYEGLPYVMLDYPRRFLKEDTLAIRTFFWWGNFFSITLQLSGSFYQMLMPCLLEAADKELLSDWYIGINENSWLHHFEETNYVLCKSVDVKQVMQSRKTLKLAKKIPLNEWDNVPDFMNNNFKTLLSLVSFKLQYGEKGL
jgi:hypothetical protein